MAVREYLRQRPVTAWAIHSLIMAAFMSGGLWLIGEPVKRGFAMFSAVLVLASPTSSLIRRLECDRNSFATPTTAETQVARLSLAVGLLSLAAFWSVPIMERPAMSGGAERGIWALMVFSVAGLLSFGLAYGARRSATARWTVALWLMGFLGLPAGLALFRLLAG